MFGQACGSESIPKPAIKLRPHALGPLQRQIVEILNAQQSIPISTTEMVDVIWPDDATRPRWPVDAILQAIVRLRRNGVRVLSLRGPGVSGFWLKCPVQLGHKDGTAQ